MTEPEKLDIIVFGATGYTGRLVCEYLNERYGVDKSVRWGIAGRNAEKLCTLADELELGVIPSFVADSNNTPSLETMARACKVVLNTAGPYLTYGTPVVAACARVGTDHVDLNGEPLWMYQVLDAYENMARASGSRIVFSCGFDSIPSDLGMQYLQEKAVSRFGHPLPRVKLRVKSMTGAASGGSAASMAATLAATKADRKLINIMIDAFALTPGFRGPAQPPANKKIFEEDLQSSSDNFVMAVINTKIVHRSNFLQGHTYGESLVYDEMVLVDEETDSHAGFFSMNVKPGEGPTREEREAGHFEVWLIGTDEEGNHLKLTVKGDRDPGYGATSRMIAETAVLLSRLPKSSDGGFHTTASLLGPPLRQRLVANAGMSFEFND